jgi:hypothetical protein
MGDPAPPHVGGVLTEDSLTDAAAQHASIIRRPPWRGSTGPSLCRTRRRFSRRRPYRDDGEPEDLPLTTDDVNTDETESGGAFLSL